MTQAVGKALAYVEIDADVYRITTFAGVTEGGPITGWTKVEGVAASTTISGDINALVPPFGRGMRVANSTGVTDAYQLFRWDTIASIRDVSLLAQIWLDDDPTDTKLFVRHQGVNFSGYLLSLRDTTLAILEGTGAAYAVRTSVSHGLGSGGLLNASEACWLKFEVYGDTSDSTVRGKVWQGDLADEPADWTVVFVDTTAPAAGRVGVGLEDISNVLGYTVGLFRAVSLLSSLTETLRFGRSVEYLPRDVSCLPMLVEVATTPAKLSLGENLGQRATVNAAFRDARASDTGELYDSGSFLGRMRARGLLRRGLPLRVYRGFVGDTFSSAFEERIYIVENTEGPTPNGSFAIVAKDKLKVLDNERAKAPVPNTGFLSDALTAMATVLTLLPSGVGSEYAVTGYATIGGKEVVQFDRRSIDIFVVLMAHWDGVDSSTTFVDDSLTTPHTLTGGGGAGNAQLETNSLTRKFGTASLQILSGGFVFVDDADSDFAFGTGAAGSNAGDFTIDFWVMPATLTSVLRVLYDGRGTLSGDVAPTINITAANVLSYSVAGTTQITGATTLSLDTYYHVALARSGNQTKLFLNGTQQGSTYTDTNNYAFFTDRPRFGINFTAASPFQGYIDELRVSKGIARWTANFTPPTSAYSTTGGDEMSLVRGLFGTTAQAHSAQDRVQQSIYYNAQSPADIIYDLFVTYGGISAADIELATWQLECNTYLQRLYTRLIAEPLGVNEVVSSLIEQAGLVVWYDDLAEQFRLLVIRAIPTTAYHYGQHNVLAGTINVQDQPAKKVTQVLTYYGTRNPVEPLDKPENFRSGRLLVDLEEEAFSGSAAIKVLYGTWIPALASSTADRINELMIARFKKPPRQFTFDVLRLGAQEPTLGGGYRLSWHGSQDEIGNVIDVPIQLVSVNPMADRWHVEAEEMTATTVVADDLVDRVIVIDSNTQNFDLYAAYTQIYGMPTAGDVANYVTLTVIIPVGVVVGQADATIGYAFQVDSTAWPAGFPITVDVRGRIQGCGGDGGKGANSSTGSAGLIGGTALRTRTDISLVLNNGAGEIWGGGGGGGGGAGRLAETNSRGGGGGGGGSGTLGGDGGAGGVPPVTSGGDPGDPGSAGTATAGGLGGNGGDLGGVLGGDGGAGGNPGLAGANGTTTAHTTGSAGAGGAAGTAIDGVSFCTITGTGDRRGPQIN